MANYAKRQKAFIKPVHRRSGELCSLALCVEDPPLVDEDVLWHFDSNARGVDIKATAVDFGVVDNADDVEWSGPINLDY